MLVWRSRRILPPTADAAAQKKRRHIFMHGITEFYGHEVFSSDPKHIYPDKVLCVLFSQVNQLSTTFLQVVSKCRLKAVTWKLFLFGGLGFFFFRCACWERMLFNHTKLQSWPLKGRWTHCCTSHFLDIQPAVPATLNGWTSLKSATSEHRAGLSIWLQLLAWPCFAQ